MFGKKFSQSNEPAIANIRMSHSENKMDERSDDVEKGQDVELGPMTRVRYLFSVGGMFCGSCSSTLETALVKLPGVEQCSVSIVTNQAIVTAKQGKVGEKMISDEIESMGYECVFIEEVILGADSSKVNTKQKFEFSIQGMSCGACAVTIENALNELPGVLNCSVSSITNKLLIEIETAHANACGPRDIISTIESIGYNAKLLDNSADGPQQKTYDEVAMWRNLMFIALIFGTPVVVLNFMSIDKGSNERLMQPIATDHGVVRYDVIMIVLNGILLLTVGFKYYRSAYYSAKHMAFGMDFLIATATSISFLYSLIVFSMGAQTGKPPVATYFDITGMLLLFITIGKYIESFSKGNSLSAIEELLKLQPSEALLVENLEITDGVQITSYNEEDYKVNSISINLIQRNDIIKVLPGSRIPADGKVIFGQSFVDESTITGESVPVLKNFGDEVFAGTLNQNQGLLMKVSSCGSHSTLSQIVKLIEQAQNTKAPIQKLSDQIAGRFTPFIIMFGVITFIVWVSLAASGAIPKSWVVHVTNGSDSAIQFALLFAISVIVISCPCALGLAVPTAIMVGSMMGAKNGLLFKSGAAFQLANNVNTIVFDKTGTLTIGKPCVTDILPLQPGVSTDELLTAAGTAEQLSEHPLALAIIAACQKPNISLLALPDKSVEAVEGRGIKCRIEDKNLEIFVGNKDFMSDCKIDVPTSAEDELHTLQDEGKTGLFVARNGVLLGILGIADMLKEDAVSGITVLKQLNYDIWICTGEKCKVSSTPIELLISCKIGDNKRTADAIGRQLNIKPEHILAGVLPKDKAEKVRQLQSNDRIVAMIGDGVNDSPALAQADIGVALGAGTQIAIEAAQVVLVQNKIEDIVVVFDLAKKVFERIYINFGWAFVYNIAAVPIAAGILYPFTKIILPPQYAAIAMAASSVSVVMSSALLTRYRRPRITNRKSLFFYSSDKQWASWTKVSSVEVVEKH